MEQMVANHLFHWIARADWCKISVTVWLTTTTTTTILWPFVWDYPGESVPEGQTILDFAEADMMWQEWHQLNHMQAICTSLQKITMPAPNQSDFYGPDALPDTQPTASKHWRLLYG